MSTNSSAMDSCTISRRRVVQRWPAVPAAAKTTPRRARSMSALGATMAPLLPPSSSRIRPKRSATTGPTSRPIRTEPVAETRATRSSRTMTSPMSRPPTRTGARSSGAPTSAAARDSSDCAPRAASTAFSEGFHTTASPATSASAVFHEYTATGKLNAEMTPTTPSGCQVSISRCPGRSLGMVLPHSWRDWPRANSQTSIISCTSPAASEGVLPASTVMIFARSSLCSPSSWPQRWTNWPRAGAGTSRQDSKACRAAPILSAALAAVSAAMVPSSCPVMGERAGRVAEAAVASSTSASTPQAFSPEVRSSVMVWSVGSAVIAVLSSDAVIWASQVPLPAGSGRRSQTTLSSLRSPVVAKRRLSIGETSTKGSLPVMRSAST